MRSVEVSGSYPGAPPGTVLRVQVREPSAGWVTFPLPTVLDEERRYRTRVTLAATGTNELRMVAPATGERSEVVRVDVR
jgi:hypothetical protein